MQIKTDCPLETIPLLEQLEADGETLTTDEKITIGKQIYALCGEKDVYIIHPKITVSLSKRTLLAQDYIVMLAFNTNTVVLVYSWWLV